MLSWKSLTVWAMSALMFAAPSQGRSEVEGGGGEGGDGGVIDGGNTCVAVDYDGSSIDTRIVSVYKEYSDCTLDEGGSFSSSEYCSGYSRCFRDKSGSSNRIWNTGCGWEIGYRDSENVWIAVARSNDLSGESIDCSTSGWTDLTLWTWYDANSAYVDRLHTGYGACYKFPRPDKSTTTGGPSTTGGGEGPSTTGGGEGPSTTGGGPGPSGGPTTTGGGEGPSTTGGGPGPSGGPTTTGGGPGPSGTGPSGTGGGPGPSGTGPSGTGEPGTTPGGSPGPSGTGQPNPSGTGPSGTGPNPSGTGPSGTGPNPSGTGQPPVTTGEGETTTTSSETTTTSSETTTTSSGTTTTAGPTIYTTVTEWQINVTIVTTEGDLLIQCADGDDSVVGTIVEESLTTVLIEIATDFTLESVSASFQNCEDNSAGGDLHSLVWMFKVTVTTTVSVDDGTTFDQVAFGETLQAALSASIFTDELNANLQAIYSDGQTSVSGAGVSMDSISVQAAASNNDDDGKGNGDKELYLLIGIIVAVVIAAIAIIYGIVRYHNRKKADDSVLISDDQAGRIASLSADQADPYAIGVVGGTATTGTYGESTQPIQNYNGLAYVQPVATDAPGKFLVMGDAIVPPAPALPGSYVVNNTETTPQNQSGEQESDEESVQQEAATVN